MWASCSLWQSAYGWAYWWPWRLRSCGRGWSCGRSRAGRGSCCSGCRTVEGSQRIVEAQDAIVVLVGDIEVARSVERDARRITYRGSAGRRIARGGVGAYCVSEVGTAGALSEDAVGHAVAGTGDHVGRAQRLVVFEHPIVGCVRDEQVRACVEA